MDPDPGTGAKMGDTHPNQTHQSSLMMRPIPRLQIPLVEQATWDMRTTLQDLSRPPPMLPPPPTWRPPYGSTEEPFKYDQPPPNMSGTGESFAGTNVHMPPPSLKALPSTQFQDMVGQQPLPPTQRQNLHAMQPGAEPYNYHGTPECAWRQMPMSQALGPPSASPQYTTPQQQQKSTHYYQTPLKKATLNMQYESQYKRNPEKTPETWGAGWATPPPGYTTDNSRQMSYANQSMNPSYLQQEGMMMPFSKMTRPPGHCCKFALLQQQNDDQTMPDHQPRLYGQQQWGATYDQAVVQSDSMRTNNPFNQQNSLNQYQNHQKAYNQMINNNKENVTQNNMQLMPEQQPRLYGQQQRSAMYDQAVVQSGSMRTNNPFNQKNSLNQYQNHQKAYNQMINNNKENVTQNMQLMPEQQPSFYGQQQRGAMYDQAVVQSGSMRTNNSLNQQHPSYQYQNHQKAYNQVTNNIKDNVTQNNMQLMPEQQPSFYGQQQRGAMYDQAIVESGSMLTNNPLDQQDASNQYQDHQKAYNHTDHHVTQNNQVFFNMNFEQENKTRCNILQYPYFNTYSETVKTSQPWSEYSNMRLSDQDNTNNHQWGNNLLPTIASHETKSEIISPMPVSEMQMEVGVSDFNGVHDYSLPAHVKMAMTKTAAMPSNNEHTPLDMNHASTSWHSQGDNEVSSLTKEKIAKISKCSSRPIGMSDASCGPSSMDRYNPTISSSSEGSTLIDVGCEFVVNMPKTSYKCRPQNDVMTSKLMTSKGSCSSLDTINIDHTTELLGSETNDDENYNPFNSDSQSDTEYSIDPERLVSQLCSSSSEVSPPSSRQRYHQLGCGTAGKEMAESHNSYSTMPTSQEESCDSSDVDSEGNMTACEYDLLNNGTGENNVVALNDCVSSKSCTVAGQGMAESHNSYSTTSTSQEESCDNSDVDSEGNMTACEYDLLNNGTGENNVVALNDCVASKSCTVAGQEMGESHNSYSTTSTSQEESCENSDVYSEGYKTACECASHSNDVDETNRPSNIVALNDCVASNDMVRKEGVTLISRGLELLKSCKREDMEISQHFKLVVYDVESILRTQGLDLGVHNRFFTKHQQDIKSLEMVASKVAPLCTKKKNSGASCTTVYTKFRELTICETSDDMENYNSVRNYIRPGTYVVPKKSMSASLRADKNDIFRSERKAFPDPAKMTFFVPYPLDPVVLPLSQYNKKPIVRSTTAQISLPQETSQVIIPIAPRKFYDRHQTYSPRALNPPNEVKQYSILKRVPKVIGKVDSTSGTNTKEVLSCKVDESVGLPCFESLHNNKSLAKQHQKPAGVNSILNSKLKSKFSEKVIPENKSAHIDDRELPCTSSTRDSTLSPKEE